MTNEILYQTGNKDYSNDQRADVTDQEPEDTEEFCVSAEGAAVGELIKDVGLLEAPADKQNSKETAQSHEDVR